jgi:hypothetical protein
VGCVMRLFSVWNVAFIMEHIYSKIIFSLGVLELGLYGIGFTQHELGFIQFTQLVIGIPVMSNQSWYMGDFLESFMVAHGPFHRQFQK